MKQGSFEFIQQLIVLAAMTTDKTSLKQNIELLDNLKYIKEFTNEA